MTSSTEAEPEQTISTLTRAVQDFATVREWDQFHDPKNLAMALASEVGELLSIFRWVHSENSDVFAAAVSTRDRLAEEIGDVGICLLLLCARARVDLGAAVLRKLEMNAIKYPAESSRGRADPPAPI